MDIQGLQRMVRKGLFSLADSLASYWPAFDDKGVAERNLTAHVCKEFLNCGFDVFFEIPLGMKKQSERLDCLFISYAHKLYVAVESKKLYGPQKAAEIKGDIERIYEFKLQDEDIDLNSAYGLILAETWRPDIATWWISDNDEADLGDDKRWKSLEDALEIPDIEVESITLYHESDKKVHKALYAIWPMRVKIAEKC